MASQCFIQKIKCKAIPPRLNFSTEISFSNYRLNFFSINPRRTQSAFLLQLEPGHMTIVDLRKKLQSRNKFLWIKTEAGIEKLKMSYSSGLSARQAANEHVLAVSRDFISQPRLSKLKFYEFYQHQKIRRARLLRKMWSRVLMKETRHVPTLSVASIDFKPRSFSKSLKT